MNKNDQQEDMHDMTLVSSEVSSETTIYSHEVEILSYP